MLIWELRFYGFTELTFFLLLATIYGNWTTRRQSNSPLNQLAENEIVTEIDIRLAHGRVFLVNLQKKSGTISSFICRYVAPQ